MSKSIIGGITTATDVESAVATVLVTTPVIEQNLTQPVETIIVTSPVVTETIEDIAENVFLTTPSIQTSIQNVVNSTIASAAFQTQLQTMVNNSIAAYLGNSTNVSTLADTLGVLGVNQQWFHYVVNSERLQNTAYRNTTGRPIQVLVMGSHNTGGGEVTGGRFDISQNGTTWAGTGTFWYGGSISAIIPNNVYYRLNSVNALWFWSELRVSKT